ncbi:MAG: NADH-dependent [FeFe] hydrogenase, group A6 [Symbiobacteriaceae bacterium]|nr:NADH-dependent [FeFe] hydrogenase, group A6 [Symbiobacteriaceae bacterium]
MNNNDEVKKVNLTINGTAIAVAPGTVLLAAAHQAGVHIPSLCYLNSDEFQYRNSVGSCRVCMVEVVGRRGLVPACSTTVYEGMVVRTDSLKAIRARRTMVELLLSNHPSDCLICERNGNCQLQQMAADMGIRSIKYKGAVSSHPKDIESFSIVRNPDKCILCRRCETMCNSIQSVGVYSAIGRGFETTMGTAFNKPIIETTCTFCGQCVSVCPTGALSEVDATEEVWKLLQAPGKVVIAQTAPAIRVALGEEFGMEPGSVITGKLAAALRRLGFAKVMDTNFTADVTIMEEASEFVHRFQHGGKLPLLTSCCPAWIKFFEHQFPDLLDVPSSCKSPMEMMGALIKSYYAEKAGVDPQDIVVVSIMPCLAKKFEAARPELVSSKGHSDVDIVLSTRELARMIREAGIEFLSLPDEEYDNPLSDSTGAADIFGTTGGVLEAALRTAYKMVTDEDLQAVEFQMLRGVDGVREAEIPFGNTKVRVAIANGLANARELLQKVQSGEVEYHIIEVMACPGGCIGGGGQPYTKGNMEILRRRAAGLYAIDSAKTIRRSYENQAMLTMYAEYIGVPYGEKAHELLHTSYVRREDK